MLLRKKRGKNTARSKRFVFKIAANKEYYCVCDFLICSDLLSFFFSSLRLFSLEEIGGGGSKTKELSHLKNDIKTKALNQTFKLFTKILSVKGNTNQSLFEMNLIELSKLKYPLSQI